MNKTPLPQSARDAADRGELIAAIEFTRDALGLSLAEAQRAVNDYVRGRRSGDAVTMPTYGPLPPAALASISRGNLIEAIKHTRAATGLGLKEAKDMVEQYIAANPHVRANPSREDVRSPAVGAVGPRAKPNFAPLIATFVVGLALTALGYWLLVAK